MADKKHIHKILISGYYGFENFGDEAILVVLIRELKRIFPDAEIVVLTSNIEYTETNYKLRAIDRMIMPHVIKEMKTADLLISGGGSLLQDVTSTLSIYYYLFIIYLAKLFGLKTFVYAQGIGPINKPLSRFLTGKILRGTNINTVRDNKSKELLNSLNVQAELTCDPVWLGLESENTNVFDSLGLDKHKKYIGVNLRPWPSVGMLELQDLARAISSIAAEDNAEVLIFPLQFDQDIDICTHFSNILMMVAPTLNVTVIEQKLTPKQWDDLIHNCNKLIAMRFHALVVALMHKIELFGISYDPKVATLMNNAHSHYLTVSQWREGQLFPKLNAWKESQKQGLTYNLDFTELKNLALKNIEMVQMLLQKDKNL